MNSISFSSLKKRKSPFSIESHHQGRALSRKKQKVLHNHVEPEISLPKQLSGSSKVHKTNPV